MSRFTSNSSNPFEDDDKDFAYASSQGSSPFDDKRQQLSRLANESEDRQLESTQRALASLYDSEAMGNATAEELLRQREVIANIEKKTDDVNNTLTTSQRHLNNIKSVFGGIKNWWGGKKDAAAADDPANRSSLDSIVKKNQDSAASHPAAASPGWGAEGGSSRGWGSAGAYDNDLDTQFLAQSSHPRQGQGQAGASSNSRGLQNVQRVTGSAREEDLDKNLGLMSDGLGRLKDLARGLGDEIEQQSETLDRVNPKVHRANDLLENQNRQMNRILKK